ncbi:MAG TPA: glycosyltransferase family 4 protein [Rhodanobacteraceae bacterium]|nr:glycosyltransferase family 4 protein [Rhodanobacteraceae bacterium]
MSVNPSVAPAIWFPTVRAGTGTDVFTERLVAGLRDYGLRAEITWLPLRSEYAPWTVPIPRPPEWANVAHVNTWLHSRFLPKDLPVVATIHHAMHHPSVMAYKGIARAAYHRYWIAPNERRVLRRADKSVAVSEFVAETARCALLDVPMQVIYNGVDSDKFRPGNRQRELGEPFRLLFVGSWKKLKGVDLLAPIMRELGDDFELRYTGGPSADSDKVDLPANMRDIGRLHGEGFVISAMQNADALLFPSRSEGHPLVVIEAMACGLPVIATRGSSLVEVIEDRVTGTLCAEGDVSAFAKACRDLASAKRGNESQPKMSRDYAARNYSIEQMVDSYLGIYRKLSEARTSPGRGLSPSDPPECP